MPVWKSRELAELIPGAKLTIIEGAPHAAEHRARRGVQRARCSTSSREAAPRRRRASRSPSAASQVVVHRRRAVELDDLEHARDGARLRARRRAAPGGGSPSRRARPNSIATPLESMKSSSEKSTTRPRARCRHRLGDRARRWLGAPAMSSSPVHARDHHVVALLDLEPHQARSHESFDLRSAVQRLPEPHRSALGRRRHLDGSPSARASAPARGPGRPRAAARQAP